MRAHLLDALDQVATAQNLIDLAMMASRALQDQNGNALEAGLIAANDRLMSARELLELMQDAERPRSTPDS